MGLEWRNDTNWLDGCFSSLDEHERLVNLEEHASGNVGARLREDGHVMVSVELDAKGNMN